MAEERNLATARATADDYDAATTTTANNDDDTTKAELQRRMEEARESITQTVSEIKDTVSTQYQNVRETITQSLDWREQFRRRPAAFSAGALGVGLLVGYSIGGALRGGNKDWDESDDDYDAGEQDSSSPRSYAGQAITGGAYGASTHAPSQAYPSAEVTSSVQRSGRSTDVSADDARPSYSSGYQAATGTHSTVSNEPQKPGLLDRFKETQAYDKLEQEVSALGGRFVDELSKTAQNVVLPALLGKLKDVIGIDLSTQREVAQRSRLEQQTSTSRASAEEDAPGAR